MDSQIYDFLSNSSVVWICVKCSRPSYSSSILSSPILDLSTGSRFSILDGSAINDLASRIEHRTKSRCCSQSSNEPPSCRSFSTPESLHEVSTHNPNSRQVTSIQPMNSPGLPLAASSPISQPNLRKHQSEYSKQSVRTTTQPDKPINCIVINCRSVRNKTCELSIMIESTNADVVMGTESWLTPDIKDSEIFPKGYSVYRKDRIGQKGGEVFILVRDSLISSKVKDLDANCELVWVQIQLKNTQNLLIGCFYRPPSTDIECLGELEISVTRARNSSKHVWLGGDFNLPGIDWSNNSISENCHDKAICNKMLQIAENTGITQMVHTPTRGDNILDLFFTSNDSLVNRVQVMPPLSQEADHDSVFLNISTKARLNKQTRRNILLYNKTDWHGLKEELQRFANSMHLDAGVQELWDAFEKKMHELISSFIPTKSVKPNSKPPWLSNELINKCKHQEKAYVTWKKSGLFEDELAFREIKAETQREIRASHTKYMETILSDLSGNDEYDQAKSKEPGKKFWTYIKQSRQDSQGVAPLYKDGIRALDSKSKANILNNQYCSVFTRDQDSIIPDKGPSPHPNMPGIEISTKGVQKLLEQLKPTKASGPDQIPARILKECALQIAPILRNIFAKCLTDGEVPQQWREANVTPIFKKGDRHNPANYRPVSLTSVICKIQEHVIAKSIMKHLENNKILVDSQHGFRAKRSCEAQLLLFKTSHQTCQKVIKQMWQSWTSQRRSTRCRTRNSYTNSGGMVSAETS